MTSSSILADWQLARALCAPLQETTALVAVRRLLDPELSTPTERRSAIDELGKLQPWGLLAILVDLLVIVRDAEATDRERVLQLIWKKILQSCERGPREQFKHALAELAIGRSDGGAVLGQLADAVRGIERKLDSEIDASYLSIERNALPSLAIAMLRSIATDAPAELKAFLGKETETGTAVLSAFLDDCLACRYGRAAALTAIDLCLDADDVRPRKRVRAALDALSGEPEQHADLLRRHARFALRDARAEPSQWLRQELISMHGLIALCRSRFGDALLSEGIPNWQDAVIAVALDQPDDGCRDVLAELLTAPVHAIGTVIQVDGTQRQNRAEIARLIDLAVAQVEEKCSNVAFNLPTSTPWVGIAPWYIRPIGGGKPTVPGWGFFVRLAPWAVAACRLLRHADSGWLQEPAAHNVGRFVLHAYYWLFEISDAGSGRKKFRDELLMLGDSVRQYVMLTAGGNYPSPAPKFFQSVASRLMSHRFGVDDPDDKRVRPEIVRQVEAALLLTERALNVTGQDKQSGRWLEQADLLVPRAVRFLEEQLAERPKTPPSRAYLIARCLRRFVIEDRDHDGAEDHRYLTGAHHLRHLLMPTADHGSWINMPTGGTPNPALDVAIAAQRVAAASQDSRTDKELTNQWHVELRAALVGVAEPKALDTFVQLRLVELLQDGYLKSEPETIRFAVLRILEFGSTRSFDALGAWLAAEDLARGDAVARRRELFVTIWRYIAALENTRIGDTGPGVPEYRAQHQARAQSLKRLLVCCLVSAGMLDARLLIGMRQDVERLRDGETFAEEEIAVEFDAEGRPMPIGIDVCDLRATQLVVYDAGAMKLRVVRAAEKNGSCVNLFAGQKPARGDRQDYLGVVVAQDGASMAVQFGPDDTVTLPAARSGLHKIGQHVKVVRAKARDAETFDWKILPLPREPGRRTSVRTVWPEFSGRQKRLALKFGKRPPAGKFGARGHPGSGLDDRTSETKNFLALFAPSERYRQPGSDYDVELARRDGSNSTRPLKHGSLCELLLAEPDGWATPVVLCVASVLRDEHDVLVQVVVELEPLRRFELDARRDFASKAFEFLSDELDRLRRADIAPEGLLLVCNVGVDEKGPKIHFSHDQVVSPSWTSQEIVGPLDFRNLDWREIFRRFAVRGGAPVSDLVIVRWQGARAIMDLPAELRVPGFPQTVSFAFDEDEPARETLKAGECCAFVDVESPHDPYAAELTGTYIPQRAIEHRHCDSIVRWLLSSDHPCERVASLKSVGRIDPNGFFNGYTAENLFVKVPVESVTLGLVLADKSWSYATVNRNVVVRVNYHDFRKPIVTFSDDVPADAKMRGEAVGIIVRSPSGDRKSGHAAHTVYFVAWRGCADIAQLTIDMGSGKPFEVGSKVIVREDDGAARTIEVHEPQFVAEVSWRVREEIPAETHRLVGVATWRGKERAIYEDEQRAGHIVVSSGGIDRERVQALLDDCNRSRPELKEKSNRRIQGYPKNTALRAALTVTNRDGSRPALLCGMIGDRMLTKGVVHVGKQRLEIVEDSVVGTDRVLVRRVFELREQGRSINTSKIAAPSTVQQEDRRKNLRNEILERWRTAPSVLGTYETSKRRILPADKDARSVIPEGIVVEPGTFSRLSPHVEFPAYRRSAAHVVLTRTDPPTGSCLAVPAATIEEMMGELNIHALDAEFSGGSLHYVGRCGDDDAAHAFEWGHGRWIEVAAEKTLYRGEPFVAAELSVAFGDCISRIRIARRDDGWALSVEEVIRSQAYVLYEQAKQKFIHVLHGDVSVDGKVAIDRVDGYAEHNVRDSGSITQSFIVTATFSEQSRREVASAIVPTIEKPYDKASIAVYGLLRQDDYTDSGGRNLCFDAVRFGPARPDGLRGIRHGDRVFVRAGGIERRMNEITLGIDSLDEIHEAFVERPPPKSRSGADTRRAATHDLGLVLRRAYSHDESALGGLLDREGADALRNRELIVRVEAADTGTTRLSFNHATAVRPRPQILIDGLLLRAPDQRLICVYVGTTSDKEGRLHVTLEIRPGFLVDVIADDVDMPASLVQGDWIRVKRAANAVRYDVSYAIQGDRRYVVGRRPVVVLPGNNLFSAAGAARALEKSMPVGLFVGDFRQIVASFAAGRDELARLMAAPHPKLAWIADKSGKVSISILNKKSILAGKLSVSLPDSGAPHVDVVFVSGKASLKVEAARTDWRHLTCAALDARTYYESIRERVWHYHDAMTVQWSMDRDGGLAIQRIAVDACSVATGPLFFSQRNRTATLRLVPGQPLGQVLGFANLRDRLPAARLASRLKTYVAGVSATGLFVEVLPGRFFEVPWGACRYDEDSPPSMDLLPSAIFGVGDTVWLSRSDRGPDKHAQHDIGIAWEHGSRNGLGNGAALLRRVRVDERGAAVYGSDPGFAIVVPSHAPATLPALALVGPQERLCDVDLRERSESGVRPAPDSVVVAIVGRNGSPTLMCWPSVAMQPYSPTSFAEAGCDVLDPSTGGFDVHRLANAIEASGGWLPLTVEPAEPDDAPREIRVSCRDLIAIRSESSDASSVITVLLVLDADERVTVAGFPGWRAWPAFRRSDGETIDWRADSLLSDVVSSANGSVYLDEPELVRRIKLAGDALPVSVEKIEFDATTLVRFSRRNQELGLSEGKLARARALGLTSDGNNVLMAVGTRHFLMPVVRLVDGAPRSMRAEIVNWLVHQHASIWVQRIGLGYFAGSDFSASGTLRVFCLNAFARDAENTFAVLDGKPISGILCRGVADHRLYWLSSDQVGAALITLSQARAAIRERPMFDVVRLDHGGISIVRMPAVLRELADLRPGARIAVKVVADSRIGNSSLLPGFVAGGEDTCLVRSVHTDLLMNFGSFLIVPEPGVVVAAEVSWRWNQDGTTRIFAVSRGKRRFIPDLPAELAAETPDEDEANDGDPFYELGRQAKALIALPEYGARRAIRLLEQMTTRFKARDTRTQAKDDTFYARLSELGGDMALRALRSFHVELIEARAWKLKRGEKGHEESNPLTERIEKIFALRGNNDRDAINEAVESFMLFATLNVPEKALPLVHAVSAAFGGRHNLRNLDKDERVAPALAQALRPFLLKTADEKRHDKHKRFLPKVRDLAKLHQTLVQEDYDFSLGHGFRN